MGLSGLEFRRSGMALGRWLACFTSTIVGHVMILGRLVGLQVHVYDVVWY